MRHDRDRQPSFTPKALNELADIVGLGRETSQFRRYAAHLQLVVENSRIRVLTEQQAQAMSGVPRKARSIAKKAAALLKAIRDLHPEHIWSDAYPTAPGPLFPS